jgi:tetratricopeptide (TPR) repeat protein
MRISALLYLILFASTQLVFSQTAKIDSLFQEHDSAKADTTKVNILLDIVREYDLDDSAGLAIAKRAFKLANRLDNEKVLARSEASLGLVYYNLQNDSASILLKNAVKRYKSINLENKVSDIYWNMSLVLQRRSDYDSAIYYLEKSLQVAQENNYLKGMAEANYSLSTIQNTRGEN